MPGRRGGGRMIGVSTRRARERLIQTLPMKGKWGGGKETEEGEASTFVPFLANGAKGDNTYGKLKGEKLKPWKKRGKGFYSLDFGGSKRRDRFVRGSEQTGRGGNTQPAHQDRGGRQKDKLGGTLDFLGGRGGGSPTPELLVGWGKGSGGKISSSKSRNKMGAARGGK